MNPRSRYGWMVLGGLLCLFGVVAVCKWRDGSVARAQSQTLPPIGDPAPAAPLALPPVGAEAIASPPPDVMPPPSMKPAGEILQASGTAPAPASVTPLGSSERPITIPASTGGPVPPPGLVTPPSGYVPPPDVAANNPPAIVPPPAKIEPANHVGEPPLAPSPGPVMTYRLTSAGETFRSLAKKTLGSHDRWAEIHKLNPTLKADAVLSAGAVVKLPADACVSDDGEAVRQLPSLRPRPAPKPRAALPLTGTYSLTLDDKHGLTLPKAILSQLGNCDTVLLSPGSDKCLWLTNQAQLDRMAVKLDKSSARETDVQNFKRLYYAQTMKVSVKDGHVHVSDKLAAFAGLHQELVLVGIDDHFEVWDAARWKHYVQAKKAKTEY